jgi:hypothetical protein
VPPPQLARHLGDTPGQSPTGKRWVVRPTAPRGDMAPAMRDLEGRDHRAKERLLSRAPRGDMAPAMRDLEGRDHRAKERLLSRAGTTGRRNACSGARAGRTHQLDAAAELAPGAFSRA